MILHPHLLWEEYSRKLVRKILAPRCSGELTSQQARSHEMRLAQGTVQDDSTRYRVTFYLLVEEADGVIADAKFHCFGPSSLIGIADAVCELAIRKNYDQASKMTEEFIEKSLRDQAQKLSLPRDHFSLLNLVKQALQAACRLCMDIPLNIHSPIETFAAEQSGEYPDWTILTKEEKLALIERVIAEEIRPYIALDEGDVEVMDLRDDREVIIGYKGACTSCYSATGATLDAIQGILRARVHPALIVIPDPSFLHPS